MKKYLTTLAALALLAGCGGTDHNEADVMFAQEMIPHHAQAVEMATMALEKSQDPDVLALAEEIEAAQEPEIETMTGWLEEWDEEVPPTEGSAASMSMDGMMTPEDMDALAQATGGAFDRLWLEQMVRHHEGAVTMAQTEQAEGSDEEAVELAQEIEQAQRAEIDEMEALLAD